MSYTKNDWKVEPYGNALLIMAGDIRIAEIISHVLFDKSPTMEECVTNAQLISAAPDLLEACKLSLKLMNDYNVSEYARMRLQQVINKAEKGD